MAYDKIIDSAKLDGALTAEANAIRAKTGEATKIAWNESTGFASAISAIESGGKIAEGQFIPINYSRVPIKNKPITISGLGFMPSRVIFYLNNGGTSNTLGVLMYDTGGVCVGTWNEYDEDSDEHDHYGGALSATPQVTFNSNGFTISANSEGDYGELCWYPDEYHYVAMG